MFQISQIYIVPAFYKISLAQNSSFASEGPSIWNSLPPNFHNIISMEDFKGKLKTHLFKESYDK